jgi:hypothetical protein
MTDTAVVAFLGLAGWYEHGVSGHRATYSKGPMEEIELEAPIRVDLRPVLDCPNPEQKILCQPNLSLSIPDDHVRNLFEGCVGSPGTTEGHPWDGKLENLCSTDSVGLRVYLAFLKEQGAIITKEG